MATEQTSPSGTPGAGAGAVDNTTLYYKAVGSIALYFATVISALVICIVRTRLTASNALYVLIAVCSLFTTWYYILSFFHKEYTKLGSDIDRFILESDLFMSVGGPLFLAQLDPNPKPTRTQPRTVPTFLALLILLGELSVIATPFFTSMSREFTLNLIATHALFLIPALLTFNPESHKGVSTFSLPRLYFTLSIIALVSHTFYTLPFFFSPIMKPKVLYNALWFNHCQTSISADMILNNVLAAVYMIQSSRSLKKFKVGLALTVALPVLSVSTVLPLYLGWRERQLVVKRTVKDEKKKA
ncbi:hypothetical protein BGX23_003749 [Mortierella sp. AD031]|nr:hypothetical protein BGX23_003749 [Mortierella sp. AD031]